MRGFGSSSTGAPNARPRQDHYSRRPGPREQPRSPGMNVSSTIWCLGVSTDAGLLIYSVKPPISLSRNAVFHIKDAPLRIRSPDSRDRTLYVSHRWQPMHPQPPRRRRTRRPREAPSAPPPGRGMLLLSRRGARIGGRSGRPWVANPRCFLALIKIKQLSQRTAISCCRRCSAVRTQDCSKATGAQRCRLALICSRGLERKMSKPVQM